MERCSRDSGDWEIYCAAKHHPAAKPLQRCKAQNSAIFAVAYALQTRCETMGGVERDSLESQSSN